MKDNSGLHGESFLMNYRKYLQCKNHIMYIYTMLENYECVENHVYNIITT